MDQEVAVNGAKERGGGTKLWTMYLKWNGKLGNSEKLRGPRNNIWKPKESLKQQKKLQKKNSQAEQFASIDNSSDKNWIFKRAKRLKWDNVYVVTETRVRNDEGKLTLTVVNKLNAWQSHYRKLLNVEFPWNASNLSDEPPKCGRVFY